MNINHSSQCLGYMACVWKTEFLYFQLSPNAFHPSTFITKINTSNQMLTELVILVIMYLFYLNDLAFGTLKLLVPYGHKRYSISFLFGEYMNIDLCLAFTVSVSKTLAKGIYNFDVDYWIPRVGFTMKDIISTVSTDTSLRSCLWMSNVSLYSHYLLR